MPGKANVSTAKGADQEAKERVAKLLAGQKDERNAWTRQNAVTAIISTQKPSALRTLSNMGVPVPGETDAAKALEEINKKINKFIVMVSGQEGMTQDTFEALTDEEKTALTMLVKLLLCMTCTRELNRTLWQKLLHSFRAQTR